MPCRSGFYAAMGPRNYQGGQRMNERQGSRAACENLDRGRPEGEVGTHVEPWESKTPGEWTVVVLPPLCSLQKSRNCCMRKLLESAVHVVSQWMLTECPLCARSLPSFVLSHLREYDNGCGVFTAFNSFCTGWEPGGPRQRLAGVMLLCAPCRVAVF